MLCLTINNYIPEIKFFGDIMVLVCAAATRIKFIYDTAIDDLEWKNPIDFGENRKTKMAANGHFVKI